MKIALSFICKRRLLLTRAWTSGVRLFGGRIAQVKDADIVVTWGLKTDVARLVDEGKKVLVMDFPYWDRGRKGVQEVFKISLNGQHPTKYLMRESLGQGRKPPVGAPWRERGDFVLVAGMGNQATVQYGYEKNEWESRAVKNIQDVTGMRIVYRSKPRKDFPGIPGCEYDDGSLPIDQAISGAHAVVCHHGNCAVEALIAGVPVFTTPDIGVGSLMAEHDMNKILTPRFPDNRQEFLNNLSFWQWSISEITAGLPLLSMRKRGLI